jgi:hypothetical protein
MRITTRFARCDRSVIRKLGCPLFLFEGRHDYNVNAKVAWEWFQKVEAQRSDSCGSRTRGTCR